MSAQLDLLTRLHATARNSAAEYAADPNVKVIVLTGSLGRGVVDRHSDIDMCLLLEDEPTQEFFEREKSRAEREGGALYHGAPDSGFAVWRRVDGVKVDFGFGTVKSFDDVLDEVLVKLETDPIKHLMVDGFRQGVALHGESILAAWNARSDVYPEALARAMIEKNLRFMPINILDGMCASRGDALFLYELFTMNQNSILGILFGLNRMYHRGKVKGLADVRFRIAPADLAGRLTRLYQNTDLHAAVREAVQLVEETIQLVEQHEPGIDTRKVRERLGLDSSIPWA